jgi:alcohol dehydrogenase
VGADDAFAPGDEVAELLAGTADGLGADVAIEAAGIPSTFELCTDLVRPCGRVANVGVHGRSATLRLERDWIRDLTITTGLVDTRTTPLLLRLLGEGKLDVSALCTHRFGLTEMSEAYDVFSQPARTGAMKVALLRNGAAEADPA